MVFFLALGMHWNWVPKNIFFFGLPAPLFFFGFFFGGFSFEGFSLAVASSSSHR
jgi:hypothetical protein